MASIIGNDRCRPSIQERLELSAVSLADVVDAGVGGTGERRCEPLSYEAVVRGFARRRDRLGIRSPDKTPHALRHTHATAMWEGGTRELALPAAGTAKSNDMSRRRSASSNSSTTSPDQYERPISHGPSAKPNAARTERKATSLIGCADHVASWLRDLSLPGSHGRMPDATNVRIMFAAVSGARLWFDVLSPEVIVDNDTLKERPTVIGVHGGPGIDSTSLIQILGPLTDIAQTIRYDQRGHGLSDPGRPDQWNVNAWADDLAELTITLGLSRRPILLGTSFGAHVALTCAARHPEQIGAVIAAYGGGRLDESASVEAFRRLGGDRAAAAAAGDPDDPEGSFQTWLDVCWPLVSRSPDGVAHLARMQALSEHSPDVHAVHAQTGLEAQLLPNLDAVACPVLIIGGNDDPLSTPKSLRELGDSLTGSSRRELVLVPNAGHTLFTDQPDTAYAAVREFIQQTLAAGELSR